MNFDEIILPLKKWWWLLVLATIAAGVSSYIVAKMQPPVYQVRTTLMVGKTIENPNPTSGDFYLEQSLAGVYADMARREPIRNATMKALGLNWLPDYVVQVSPNSQIIEVQVTDTNPQRATLVASQLANQLIQRSPTTVQSGNTDRQAFVEGQLNSLQEQITSSQEEIVTLQKKLDELSSAKQIADTQSQINALQTKISTLQSNYAGLLANTQKGAVNSLTIVEPAELPTVPISQRIPVTVVIAMTVGLILASAGAYGIEFFDRTIKTDADIARVLKTPVVGHIPEIDDKGNEWRYFLKNPRTLVADAFRSLRWNIILHWNNHISASDDSSKTLFISSFLPSSGKTTISSNIAASFMTIGKKVILVDADLYRPRVHEVLEMPIGPGLSDVLIDRKDIHSVTQTAPSMPELKVITAGELLEEPAEALQWKMDQVITSLKSMADIVIIDGPPIGNPIGIILSTKIDGILMVVNPGRVDYDGAKVSMEQLYRSKANIIGAILNRISSSEFSYYSGQNYYTKVNVEADKKAAHSNGRGLNNLFDTVKSRLPQNLGQKLPSKSSRVEK